MATSPSTLSKTQVQEKYQTLTRVLGRLSYDKQISWQIKPIYKPLVITLHSESVLGTEKRVRYYEPTIMGGFEDVSSMMSVTHSW